MPRTTMMMMMLLLLRASMVLATVAAATGNTAPGFETGAAASHRGWMNAGGGGPEYSVANAPRFDTSWVLADPTVRRFDVYSKPIRSRYSQVHWTNHGPMPLPQDVVDRYSAGNITTTTTNTNTTTTTMAVVGYEVDQVRIDPHTGDEVSVPITWAYNHHYMVFLLGSTDTETATTMKRTDVTPSMRKLGMGHGGGGATWLPEIVRKGRPRSVDGGAGGGDATATTGDDKIPSWIFVSEGNGGEMRKSYHAYPRGYAQLLSEPRSYSITPMQIDTWNRDTMAANTSKFVPPPAGDASGYFPSSTSRSVVNHLDRANYNPLMECPCTDRLAREWGMTYKLLPLDHGHDGGNDGLENSTECFDAASSLLPSSTGTVHRTIEGGDRCGTCLAVLSRDGSLDVTWKRPSDDSSSDVPSPPLADPTDDDDDRDASLVGSTPLGSIVNATVVLHASTQTAEITLKGPYLEDGDNASDDGNENGNDRWFAIGWGADSMCIRMDADECTTGGPYAIVVLPPGYADGRSDADATNATSRVVERKLAYHGAGEILHPGNDDDDGGYDLEVLSNAIEYDDDDDENRRRRRVVRLRRPLKGPTEDHYSFRVPRENKDGNVDEKARRIPVILATGCPGAARFGRHCGHQSPSPIALAEVGRTHRIVRDGIKGSLGGNPFSKRCLDEPYGDLVKQRNPTCSLQTYRGGLSCCLHDHYLLDANQTVPWRDQVLEYRLKFRFYYQDYVPASRAAMAEEERETDETATAASASASAAAARELDAVASSSTAASASAGPRASKGPSHENLARVYWTTEAGAGEYDVPECTDPSRPDGCVHTISSRWKVRESMDDDDVGDANENDGIELIYAAPHCHAPTCLSMELYNADTGRLLCRVEPVRGTGREGIYDEEGFLAIPPCLWSSSDVATDGDDGLPPPLPPPEFLAWNATLESIKRANNTFPHTGEMASWQMRAVVVPAPGAAVIHAAEEEPSRSRGLRRRRRGDAGTNPRRGNDLGDG